MNFGDKTQLLVLSFSSKTRVYKILLGVAIGSFFSHGIAILFGSSITLFDNPTIHSVLKWITYLSFILMGIISFLPKKETLHMENNKKEELAKKVRFDFWEKYDDTHTVIRFATSWATTKEDVDALCNLLCNL